MKTPNLRSKAQLGLSLPRFSHITFLAVFVILSLGLGHYGIRQVWGQLTSGTTVFGPKVYSREKGKPHAVVDTFSVTDTSHPFTLVIKNGSDDGSHRVSSAVITINGLIVVGPDRFNEQVDGIKQSLVLQPDNEIAVEIRGKPKDFITVSIVGEHLNQPPEADAGPDQSVPVGAAVVLDGS
ncbi:MAG: hypothetical protein ACU84J_14225, partial [Gammaproteobacteria bacterium]